MHYDYTLKQSRTNHGNLKNTSVFRSDVYETFITIAQWHRKNYDLCKKSYMGV